MNTDYAIIRKIWKPGSTRCHAPTHGAKPPLHHVSSRSSERELRLLMTASPRLHSRCIVRRRSVFVCFDS